MTIAIVSNGNGRELNAYRIQKFKLGSVCRLLHFSCFVHIRNPDVTFQACSDIAQAQVSQAVYIDNTPMFVKVAESLGIHGILHTDCKSTRAKLSNLGLDTE